MLQNIKELFGSELMALDAHVGRVKDFYFDDKAWVIRYLVADTGAWLTGHQVLIAPHAFAKYDEYEKTLHLKLSKKQIQNCPPIEAHKPVSRQYEEEYFNYYGWSGYWNGGRTLGAGRLSGGHASGRDGLPAAGGAFQGGWSACEAATR